MLNEIYNQINDAVFFETGLEQRACELIKRLASSATIRIEVIQSEIKRGNFESEKEMVNDFMGWSERIETAIVEK